MTSSFTSSTPLETAINNPRNMGELPDADSIGTVGSPDCGDMLRIWIKFREENGHKVIDRATFQTFGCQTALAVASIATDLIVGKTAQEALNMSGEELAAPLGALPPMKIHCAQLVESALRNALAPTTPQQSPLPQSQSSAESSSLLPSLLDSFQTSEVKITLNPPS